jgi:hypothetical protein
MSMLAFTPDRNTKKADYSAVFLPEAKKFLAHHGAPQRSLHQLELRPKPQAIADVMLEKIAAARDLEVLALFCHGFHDGIQLGFRLRTVRKLAEALAKVARQDLRVILYACSTARGASDDAKEEGVGGEGGFADALRDALCAAGISECQVDAHATAGHAVWNPNVRRFRGEGSPVGGQGGGWIVQPRKQPLWKPWQAALRSGSFAYDFPLLGIGEIHERLLAVS